MANTAQAFDTARTQSHNMTQGSFDVPVAWTDAPWNYVVAFGAILGLYTVFRLVSKAID